MIGARTRVTVRFRHNRYLYGVCLGDLQIVSGLNRNHYIAWGSLLCIIVSEISTGVDGSKNMEAPLSSVETTPLSL